MQCKANNNMPKARKKRTDAKKKAAPSTPAKGVSKPKPVTAAKTRTKHVVSRKPGPLRKKKQLLKELFDSGAPARLLICN